MATMVVPSLRGTAGEIFYPESDGKPMADSMTQAQWMVLIMDNLTNWFRDDPQVLVAVDLLWYPVEGNAKITLAPDVMIVFGRPKYPRPSYKQWEERGIGPQVVFEILSDSNKMGEMIAKSEFYQRYGVEEFYLYDPETGGLEVILYTSEGMRFFPIEDEWVSPRLGIRFVPQPRAPMELYLPDGAPFRSFTEQSTLTEYAKQQTREARERAEAERGRADAAQAERDAAQAERDAAQAERDAERAARARRDAKLRELGVDPDTL